MARPLCCRGRHCVHLAGAGAAVHARTAVSQQHAVVCDPRIEQPLYAGRSVAGTRADALARRSVCVVDRAFKPSQGPALRARRGSHGCAHGARLAVVVRVRPGTADGAGAAAPARKTRSWRSACICWARSSMRACRNCCARPTSSFLPATQKAAGMPHWKPTPAVACRYLVQFRRSVRLAMTAQWASCGR